MKDLFKAAAAGVLTGAMVLAGPAFAGSSADIPLNTPGTANTPPANDPIEALDAVCGNMQTKGDFINCFMSVGKTSYDLQQFTMHAIQKVKPEVMQQVAEAVNGDQQCAIADMAGIQIGMVLQQLALLPEADAKAILDQPIDDEDRRFATLAFTATAHCANTISTVLGQSHELSPFAMAYASIEEKTLQYAQSFGMQPDIRSVPPARPTNPLQP